MDSDDDDELAESGLNASTTSFGFGSGSGSRTRPSLGRKGQQHSYSGAIPLTADAQMPAGHGQGQLNDVDNPTASSAAATGAGPQPTINTLLDDDDELLQAKARIAARQAKEQRKHLDGSGSARAIVDRVVAELRRIAKGGPRVYTGDRLVHLNHAAMNAPNKWPGNSVSTSKYNFVTFVPKFLLGMRTSLLFFSKRLLVPFVDFCTRLPAEQFSKYANVFFLFIAAIQQIPNVSPTNRFTTILPLGIVLLVAALKEIKEDVVRSFSWSAPPSSRGTDKLS